MIRLVNNELERMWKEAVVVYLRFYPSICQKGLRKPTKTANCWCTADI
jgi:hypothetical protein